MFWITKRKHNDIVEQYRKAIENLNEALNRKEKFEEICDKLADKVNNTTARMDGYASCSTDIMDNLDDSVPRYVDDYFGGKVIKQESTPVTILDENGKATYAVTAKKAKGENQYILEM